MTSGIVTVETDMTDIGTGSYTIIGQTAAEMMGVPLDKVVVKLGDSAFPVSSGSGGQWGANSSTSGVYAACVKLREAVAKEGSASIRPRRCSRMARFAMASARVRSRRLAGDGGLVAEDAIEFGDLDKQVRALHVSARTSSKSACMRSRAKRAYAACWRCVPRAASSIPKSARSQIIGAMAMGVGAALMEELAIDKRHGFFVNHDLASYEVPVHADIPHQDVIFLEEADPTSPRP